MFRVNLRIINFCKIPTKQAAQRLSIFQYIWRKNQDVAGYYKEESSKEESPSLHILKEAKIVRTENEHVGSTHNS